jgi:hypothetical protein
VTPEQRRLRAQIAANTRWSRPMAREDQAEAARSAFYARLERQVDPEGRLSPDERAAGPRRGARILCPAQFREGEDPSASHIRLRTRRINPECPCHHPWQGHSFVPCRITLIKSP